MIQEGLWTLKIAAVQHSLSYFLVYYSASSEMLLHAFFFLNYLGNRHTGKKEMKHKNNEQAIGSNTKLRAVSKDVSEERVCGVCCLCSSFSWEGCSGNITVTELIFCMGQFKLKFILVVSWVCSNWHCSSGTCNLEPILICLYVTGTDCQFSLRWIYFISHKLIMSSILATVFY